MGKDDIKVGLIIPAQNTNTRSDLEKILPKNTKVYETRIFFGEVKPENLILMERDTGRASTELAAIPCDLQVLACTSGSFIGGLAYEKEIVEQINRIAKCPAITTTGAAMEAIHSFGVSRIALCTPYTDLVNRKEVEFLTSFGLEITKATGMGILEPRDILSTPREKILEAARTSITPETELLFISCTGLHSTELISQLEDELGIPVIGSNQVTAWAILRHFGLLCNANNYGSLFDIK